MTITLRRRQRTPPPGNHATLKEIYIESLFGRYNFSDRLLLGVDPEHSNISFLYGDNGVGKTTLLKLLYALLSPERNSGHRTTLARTKFLQFGVEFSDGQKITVHKTDYDKHSPYTILMDGPRLTDEVYITPNSTGRVGQDTERPEEAERYAHLISTISPTLVFVNDHRTIRSTYEPWDLRSFLNTSFFSNSHYRVHQTADGAFIPSANFDIDSIASTGLERLLFQTHSHFVDRALSANARANTGVEQVYLGIARGVSRSQDVKRPSNIVDDFFSRVIKIRSFIEKYARFGVVEVQYLDRIVDIVSDATPSKQIQLVDVLETYISSIEKRIETAKSLVEQMSILEDRINDLLNRKRIFFRIDKSFYFRDDKGDELAQEELSSGEQHLLYLCCTALLSNERQCIIMVDEPELSLNFKWQRHLVESLLAIAGNSAQFIMATHSFEIISRYREAVIRLEPQ